MSLRLINRLKCVPKIHVKFRHPIRIGLSSRKSLIATPKRKFTMNQSCLIASSGMVIYTFLQQPFTTPYFYWGIAGSFLWIVYIIYCIIVNLKIDFNKDIN